MYSKSKLFLMVICFALGSGRVLAGTGSSGGGASIACQSTVNVKVELYDLFEGKIRQNYTYNKLLQQPDTVAILSSAISKISNYSHRILIQKTISDIRSKIKVLPAGLVLNAPTDLGNQVGIIVPQGCSLQAVGYFEADDTLLVSSDLYDKMDPLNQAAFLLHEAIYYAARTTSKAADSYSSRKLTSALLSDSEVDLSQLLGNTLFQEPEKNKLNIAAVVKTNSVLLNVRPTKTFTPYSGMFLECYDKNFRSIHRVRYDDVGFQTVFDISACTYVRANFSEYIGQGSVVDLINAATDYKTIFDWVLLGNEGLIFEASFDFSNYLVGKKNLILIQKN